jgi:hypothetical protein
VQQEILKAACCDPEVFEILASKADLVSAEITSSNTQSLHLCAAFVCADGLTQAATAGNPAAAAAAAAVLA